MILAGLLPANSWLRVQGALYGLRESPSSWGASRDEKLQQIRWKGSKDQTLQVVQCKTDVSLWLVKEIGTQRTIGSLGVYVDDLMLWVDKSELEGALQAIRAVWKCSEPQYADSEKGLTFCGLEIRQTEGTTFVHQATYIQELAKRYGNPRASAVLPDFKGDPPEEEPDSSGIQKAQRVVGELTWIAGRARPDISFAVNRLSRLVSGYPEYVQQNGLQIIRYLIHTQTWALRYGQVEYPDEFVSELPVARRGMVMETFADASFAQDEARSQSGVIITISGAPLAWLSSRQPFTALSTCEAELIACTEALVLSEAVMPLLQEITEEPLTWVFLNDSVSANSVLTYPAGAWRTQNLRVRCRAFHEYIEMGSMLLHHIPGKFMLGDLLTKPLAYSKIRDLMSFLGVATTDGGELQRVKPYVPSKGQAGPVLKVLTVAWTLPLVEAQPMLGWRPWSFQEAVWVILGVMLGIIIVVSCGFWYQRRLRLHRLSLLQELADQVRAETQNAPHHPFPIPEDPEHDPRQGPEAPIIDGRPRWNRRLPEQATINREPEPELEPYGLVGFLSNHGSCLVEFLDSWSPEVLRIKELSGGTRLRIASVWAQLHPRPPPSFHEDESEGTDSGMTFSSQSTLSSMRSEWDRHHYEYRNVGIYDPQAVENAMEVWHMSRRPYGPELEALPFFQALTEPERSVLNQMIDVYYLRSPRASTPQPAHLIDREIRDEGINRRQWMAHAAIDNEQERAERELSAASDTEVQPDGTMPVRQAVPIVRLEASSDEESDGPTELDRQAAGAAFFLYQMGYEFNWEQMSPVQQDLYHSHVGRLLRSIEEVD